MMLARTGSAPLVRGRVAPARTLWLLLATCAALLLTTAPALAAPNVSLVEDAPDTVLFGTDATVHLTAKNTSGPVGYNASFRYVLPAGTSYAGGAAVAPRIIADAPTPGSTTLLFENVGDLPPNASYTLTFKVRHTTYEPGPVAVGTDYATSSGVYVNSDPRWVPDFATDGTPVSGASSFTGSATASDHTRVTAIELDKDEPSPEGELLRGVHDNRTIYTLTVRNNDVNPTSAVRVEDWLPAGLEYLGCGAAGDDGSVTTPEEYPGSGPLNATTLAGVTDCPAPDAVTTVEVDPDGPGPDGPLPFGVYTHLQWDLTSALAPGEERPIRYVAGIPNRENELFPLGSLPAQEAPNLDNNTGPETTDEQALTNYANVGGTYDGLFQVADSATITRQAEDVRLLKHATPDTLQQGQAVGWTLDVDVSEYRSATNVAVADVVPDGLCPLGETGENYESDTTTECDGGAGLGSSPGYDTAPSEQADGSWKLGWTLAGTLAPGDHRTITYSTRTRTHYQEGFADAGSVSAHDGLTNDASLTADTQIRPGVNGAATSTAVDASEDTLHGDGPTLLKQVQETSAGLVDCTTGTYADSATEPFRADDKVCYRLRVTFPEHLDTPGTFVTDFLPPGTTYVAGSAAAFGANTIGGVTTPAVGGALESVTWDLGTVPAGSVFEVVLAATLHTDPSHADEDITDNLLKLRYNNSPGDTFPLRTAAPVTLEQPAVSLTKGVSQVKRAGSGTFTTPSGTPDSVVVNGGDVVRYAVQVTNGGSRDADSVEVWDVLPTQITCAEVDATADGGTCLPTGGPGGVPIVRWVIASIGSGGSATVHYDVDIPVTHAPSTRLDNHAGVREFTSPTNTGGAVTYAPSSNIDPTQTPSAPSADDTSRVTLAASALTKARTTALGPLPGNGSQAGNALAGQATIGEVASYTVTFTVPQGTTVHGPIAVADPLTSPRFTYIAGSAAATFDADGAGGAAPTALPGGWTLSDAGATIRLDRATDYLNAAGSGDDVFTITYQAAVADVPANARGGATLDNTATLTSLNDAGATVTTTKTQSTTIVEPDVAVAKTFAGSATVAPGDERTFTVTASNRAGTGVSTANDVVVADVLPPGVTPLDGSGDPLTGDGSVGGSPYAGAYTQADHTIRWTIPAIDPGVAVPLTYGLRVDEVVSGAKLDNSVALTASSHPGSPPAGAVERSYDADDAASLRVVTLGVAKSVTPASPTRLSIGDSATYTVDVTVPAGITIYDATALDTLPAGMVFDGVDSTTCVGGCSLGATLVGPAPSATGPATLAFFLGDVGTTSATPRVVRIVYRAHVADDGTLTDGDTATNTVTGYSNSTDKITGTPATPPAAGGFDDQTGPQTATIRVGEPDVTITKAVSGDGDGDGARTTEPGDTYTYTVAVTNTGTVPAYDVLVRDTPDAALVGVVATDGAADVEHAWTAAQPYTTWRIPGPIAVGATATVRYTAALANPPAVADGDTVPNTADVEHYLGRPAADCTAPGAVCHAYDGPSATVTLTVALPQLSIVKTTGAAGSPDSAGAEVGQPFGWRIVVTNDATAATAHDVDVTDVLPAGWTYVAGTSAAVRAPGAVALTPGNPAVTAAAGGDTLAWSDVTDLAPGASVTLTFDAKPTTAALSAPGAGVGATHPHVNVAHATAQDGGGVGGYDSGSDDAEAILSVPSLEVTKSPDGATRTAGTSSSWTVNVKNTGAVLGRNLRIVDVLPAGVHYTAGAASVTGGSGYGTFSEASYDAPTRTITWELTTLAAGTGEVEITVPVDIDASVASGAVLTNAVSATSDEQPTPVGDDGSFVVATSADVRIAKSAPATAVPGEELEYTLRVDNDGPSDARDVAISDPLPAAATFVSAAGCTAAAGTVSCPIGTLAAGAHETRTVRVKLDPGATAPVVNTATVTTTTPQTDTTNDEDDATTALLPSVNLRIAKTADPATVREGQSTTFTLAVHNDGPSDAVDVTVADPLPAGLEPTATTASQGACTVTGQRVECLLGTLGTGKDATITVTARAAVPATFENVATVATSTPDRDPADDHDSATVVSEPLADLRIAKDGPAEVAAGGLATYRLVATNGGPSPATGVTITDELPAGVQVTGMSAGCAVDARTVRCPVGGLAVGASAAVEVTVRVPDTAASQSLQDVGRVAGDQGDPDLTNNVDPHTTRVGAAADLRVIKESTALTAGGQTTYRLLVHNAGPSDATGVTLTDPLPAGTAFVRVQQTQGSCREQGGTVTCALGALAAGRSAAVQVVVRVTAPAGTTVANRATVAAEQLDPQPENNAAAVSGTVAGGPLTHRALTLTKVASQARPGIDRSFTYTLTVTNRGPDKARQVVITDPMPDGVRTVRATPTQGRCSVTDAVVRCALGTLAAKQAATVRIVARALRPGTFRNVALVSADGDQASAAAGVTGSGEVASVKVRATAAGRLTLTKRAAKPVVTTGSTVAFRITVRASGGAVSGVQVCDRLPSGLVFAKTGGARLVAGQACWKVALLKSGASRSFTVVARAERDARGVLRNVATATGDGTTARRATATVRTRSGAILSNQQSGVTG